MMDKDANKEIENVLLDALNFFIFLSTFPPQMDREEVRVHHIKLLLKILL
jgi:hypothetical protein